MTFNVNSGLVQLYVRKINEGFPKEEVPALYNLREVVFSIVGA